MENKKITVLLLKEYKGYIKIIYFIWKTIEKKLLKKGYQIEYEYINYEDTLEKYWLNNIFKHSKKKIDVVVFSCTPNNYDSMRKNKVNMSFPLFFRKILLLFKEKDKYNNSKYYFYIDILKQIYFFIIIFILFSFVLHNIAKYLFNFKMNFFEIFNASLGDNQNFLKKKSDNNLFYFYIIFICFVFHILFVMLHSLIATKASLYIEPINSIDRNLYNKKILVNKQQKLEITIMKKHTAGVLESDNVGLKLIKEYLENNKKYDAVILEPSYLPEFKINGNNISFDNNKYNLKISSFVPGFDTVNLPISNKKNLLDDINSIIIDMSDEMYTGAFGNKDVREYLCKSNYNSFSINDNLYYTINEKCSNLNSIK